MPSKEGLVYAQEEVGTKRQRYAAKGTNLCLARSRGKGLVPEQRAVWFYSASRVLFSLRGESCIA